MEDPHHDPDDAAAAERAARAVRSLDVPAPPGLRTAVERAVADAQRPRRRRGLRGRSLFLALAGATAAVAAVVLVLALGLSNGTDESAPPVASPTVPEAARLALGEPTAGAPRPVAGARLDASIAGIDFPDWSSARPDVYRAAGVRTDELGGRTFKTVVYDGEGGERIGYAIADGEALPWGDGEVVERNGVRLWVYELSDVTVVAWLRDGHTCILAGRGVDRRDLMRLASSRNA